MAQPPPHARFNRKTVIKASPKPGFKADPQADPQAGAQAAAGSDPVHVDAELLGRLPQKPMTAQEQSKALQAIKQQADTRVRLGKQLLQAANTRLTQQHDALQAIRAEQQTLRDQLQQDVAQSLQQYDQWLGHADERFTQRIEALENRMNAAETQITAAAQDLQRLLVKANLLITGPPPPPPEGPPESPPESPLEGPAERSATRSATGSATGSGQAPSASSAAAMDQTGSVFADASAIDVGVDAPPATKPADDDPFEAIIQKLNKP